VRLGFLICGSLETISGGFLYDRMLIQHLSRRGDQIQVISLPWRPYGPSLLDNLSPTLFRQLKKARLDVLLQDELAHPVCFWLNRRLKALVPYPLVSLVHHLRNREARAPWQNLLYRWVERQYLASVDGFVWVSQTSREDVQRLVGAGRPGVVAYPGRDRLPGGLTREEIVARARAPLTRIIFLGNLIPRKGLHTLLTALAGLNRDDWHLTVAGSLTMDAPYVEAIRRQIRQAGLHEKVALLGTLSDRELIARLAESHLLAVPSSYEGFGMVYLEGMQFGLPAIASQAGAAREIIRPGDSGFLVPPEDPGALARCLGRLLTDRELLIRLSLAARQQAAAHPTWQDTGDTIYAFLHSFRAGNR
jgi:glycosyltransferase involved in cell wall biosynthesis